MLKGIDISACQNPHYIDYDKVAESIDFAILRCGVTGYGNNPPYSNNFNKDSQFETHYKELSKRDVPIGVYYYGGATTTAEAKKEAEIVIKAIKGKKIEYPVFYDTEENRNQGTLDKKTLTEVISTFMNKVKEAGYLVGIYSALWWSDNKFDQSLKNENFWLAHWVDRPGEDCKIWQYGTTNVPGFNGPVDGDISYVDYRKLVTEGGLNNLPKKEETIDLDNYARRVLSGEFGNGQARKDALGELYYPVQNRVNEILREESRIEYLARRTIQGEFGNGQDRVNALGNDYNAVQAKVNELLRR